MANVSSETKGDSSAETMGDASGETNENSTGETIADFSEWEKLSMEDVPKHIEEHGVSGIEEFFKAKLERWKNVEIHIGITGDSGVGKSSFINTIRGLGDNDENAAKAGVTQTTSEAANYHHPTNNKIEFWDLPGIGTPDYPDLETYCNKVGLEKYDTFLILTAVRFTKNDLLLAEKVKSMGKAFFFVRTKIDVDVHSERRKDGFNEEEMLNDIRQDCLKNLKGFGVSDEIVFLISNHDPAKWDFDRLTQAILDGLPLRLKESLTLSLNSLTTLSKDLLKRKAEILRGRIWMAAAASGVGAVVPVPELSGALDLVLLTREVNMYKSQLGLPEETSYKFQRMTPKIQAQVGKFCLTSTVQIANHLKDYTGSSVVEKFTRYIPFVGCAIAGGISFSSTYCFLRGCLNELEGIALDSLDEINTRVGYDMDLDYGSCKTNVAESEWEHSNKEGVQEHIKKYDASGIERFFKAKLEKWKDVEINIGVTGDAGVGKSSFINVIRGLKDDDEGAAETGFKETTIQAAVYPHPTNKKIKFWDLPGI
ncbi:interferon-inducible GTPase 5-like, partial [Paramuricea clavata]